MRREIHFQFSAMYSTHGKLVIFRLLSATKPSRIKWLFCVYEMKRMKTKIKRYNCYPNSFRGIVSMYLFESMKEKQHNTYYV